MPPGARFMGTKMITLSRHLTNSYLIALFDQESGEFAAILDANDITACRTGATSAVAVDAMTPQRSLSVGVLGSGHEAKAHVRAIARVRDFTEIRVFSPSRENRQAFAHVISDELGIGCEATETAEDAVAGADLIIAAARSRDETPILDGAWLSAPGCVVSIGSTLPEQREIDSAAIDVADLIVCDTVAEVTEETGDFLAAKADGVKFEHKVFGLSDLVRGEIMGRLDEAGLVMFKSAGSGLQDIAVAELAFSKAVERGLAVALPAGLAVKDGSLSSGRDQSPSPPAA